LLVSAETEKQTSTEEISVNVSLTESDDPPLDEALASPEASQWIMAMHEEIESLHAMDVVEESELPRGRKAIRSKWVLRQKRDENGHIAKYKARLVAKGFSQIPGQDFTQTFAPVAKWDSLRVILALATKFDWELHHLDVKTAFLNAKLDEEIYLEKPEIAGKGYWKLLKGLYGLRQSGRQWYLTIHQAYTKMGFKRCESDWSVYSRRSGNEVAIIGMSVDDILLAASSKKERDCIITELSQHFQISDLGEAKWLLGCRINRDRAKRTIKLDQEQYIHAILTNFESMEKSNGVNSPMEPSKRLSEDMSPRTDEERRLVEREPYKHYRELVGKLMYLVTCTRPDLAFAVRELAKFMSNYGAEHYKAARRVVKYLAKMRTTGVTYHGQLQTSNSNVEFRVFSDSDWAQSEGRKSVSGYMVEMANGPIAWSSKQQSVVALSSCEAEYLATTHAAKQTLWTRSILDELGFTQTNPTILYCDNRGTVYCTHDPQHHSAMKHIDIRIHFIRDCVNKNLINVHHISGTDNVADLLTKALGPQNHIKWLIRIGMYADPAGVL
jgi:hypothetical protein